MLHSRLTENFKVMNEKLVLYLCYNLLGFGIPTELTAYNKI